ncbi:protein Daple-like isoform X2 [Acipenser ruthenus]|uniref:protein Daple-like isoform X2 n=1 Tax=Acipenser ruthenus TaxID=7906 RepID=UPI0027406F1D|nr:protein Daple-like isoform X2 [Acipenser ruthenus]
MDVTVSELMGNFLECPLVTWVKTFGPLGTGDEDKLSMYLDLVDGVFLNKIMLKIDPSPTNQRVNRNVNNDVNLRIQNLTILVRHIKNYYQENLQQLIVMNLPNVLTIGKDPLTCKSMEEIKTLLLLILGCAVQCERKEEFIEKIKQLDIETQAAIVTHIQEVTHNQENVFDLQWLEMPYLPPEDLDSLSRNMVFHLRKLIDERDDSSEVIVELTQERDYLQSQQPLSPVKTSSPETTPGPVTLLSKEDRQHLAVELADCKAKLRRTRQELEEKTEQLIDTKNEVDRLDLDLQKLKQENIQLTADARSLRAYRDELDSFREKASRVDKLETELARCKERLHDVHFYKARMEELREDNVTLIETKTMLEEQLTLARGRCDKLHELEKENLQLRSKLHDIELDRDTDKKRIEELSEENMVLEIAQKQSMNESAHLGWELEQMSRSTDVNDARKSFVFELNESASSRILKLEKENQGLQNTIQELRDTSLTLEEGNLRSLELVKENQQISKKIEKLQSQLDQEKQTNQDMETLVEELLKEKQKLMKNMETMRGEKDRQISELEQENDHLNQTVTSLRQRAEIGSEARVKDVEKENRILHETITDTGSKLTQLEFEKKQVRKELVQLKEKVQKSEELEKEVQKLERTNEQLQKKLASLTITCDKIEALEQENCILEMENRKLKKLADNAHNAALRIETVEKDNHQLEEENLEMRRTVETLKFTSTKLAQMELENKELEKEKKEELARNMDMMKALSKKSERLEVSYQALDSENQRLQQTLENSNKKIQHLEKEVQDTEKENQQLQKSLEELTISSKRLEKLERDNHGLEQEVTQLEKDKKQLEKEAKRLWQQVEVKEAALDESGLKVATLEKESKTLEKELSKLKEASNKAREVERENKDMQKQATIDKRTLATLREDLVHEKLKSQQQSNELEKLNQELEKIGLNKEKLLQEEHSSDDNKYKILETKIESTLQKTLEIKEEKIQALESRLEESSNLNQQLRSELTSVKKNLEAMKQRQEEEAYHLNSAKISPEKQPPNSQNKEKWETEHRETTMELLKVKDRVIDTEKCNAALQAEKHLLKEQLKQLDSQNNLLNSQIVALQRQAASLQEHNTALQTQTAKLQVENSTLNSQSVSLMAQNAMLQSQQSSMETDAENVVKQKEELKAAHESLLLDHERFMALHERQSVEYETLISQHGSLKMTHKALEHEYRDLDVRYGVLLRQKAAMEELEMALKSERENLAMEKQKSTLLLGENNNLKEEIDRFTFMHRQLQEEYDGLQLHTKELKTALNNSQLDLNRWQARYDELKEQHQNLDISLTKLDNHCELLNRLKGNLEEENHHLLSQIQMLSQQNQTLLERTMESKELYHEEQKQYIDKLNTLRRQKEKLEEKIMDQYKFYDPAPKKKNNWVGAKALVKLIKPKKDGSRERPKSTPESLAQPSDYPDGLPPLPPPPLPPRLSHLSLDNNLLGSHSLEENLNHTPTTRAFNDSGVKLRGMYRSAGSNENMESPEAVARRRRMELGSMAYSTSAIHMSASSSTPIPGSRQTLRPKGFISDDDLRLQSFDAVFANSSNGNQAYRTNALDHSRNASNSSSPVNSKGSCDRIQGRSVNLSSDEVISGHESATLPREGCLYHSGSAFISSSKQEPGQCVNGLASYDTPQKGAPSHPQGRARPSLGSPSGELVTLEEFLQESNNLSPPTRRHSLDETELISLHEFLAEADSMLPSDSALSRTTATRRLSSGDTYSKKVQTNIREDLMSDYFKKINESPIIGKQSTLKDVAKMPTNYVMPTIKAAPADSLDGRSKPGQSVKPSIRPPDPQPQTPSNAASVRQTQTLPTRSRQAERLAQTQQQPGTRGGSGNLSRTFSLASADLLRSNGPDNCMQESSPKPAAELNPSPGIVVRRQATVAHERPQSARLSGSSSQGGELHYRTVDPRRLSLAPPKDDPRPLSPQQHPQHQSSTLSLSGSVNNPNVARAQAERYGATGSPHYCPAQQGPPRSVPQQPPVRPVSQHRGEVAMVTPVRAVPPPKEKEMIGEQRQMDTSLSKSLAKSPERGSSTEGPGTEDLNQSNSSTHKSTPASPDPSNDPQSVWYEYGCV